MGECTGLKRNASYKARKDNEDASRRQLEEGKNIGDEMSDQYDAW